MLVSVIIPIYNVAPYLRECLDSALNQTYSNLEIILVNDGSTDESEAIAKEYLKDPRVCLISQKNCGLSCARNVGMRKARGEFMIFIDSDDYIASNYIQEMLDIALNYEVDFVCNENIVRFVDRPLMQNRVSQIPKIYTPNASNICFGGAVWRFLFSSAFLKECKVKFLEGKIYEDEAFLYMVAPLASKFVKFFGEPYFYRQRENSIMAKHQKVRSYDLLDVFEAIYLFYQERGLLGKFNPPDYFLYSCAVGYKNEKEYLLRAKKLAKKLSLSSAPPPYKLSYSMQKFLQKNVDVFIIWIRVIWRLQRLQMIVKRICKCFKKRI